MVSGLAIGIDAAAHEGALDAGGSVVGVLGTGLDVVYPRRHRALFDRVRDSGLLVSELGYGVQPRRESFPVRNRIIAGLAELVVVVEATLKGGARITAERALEYGRTVMAYPGSRRNPSAAGTNSLLYDGASVVLEPADVLVQLEFDRPAPQLDLRVPPIGDAAAVLAACHGEPATLDQLASRAGLAPSAVVAAVRELERGRMDGTRPRTVLAPMSASGLFAGELRVALLGERAHRLLHVRRAEVHHLRRRLRLDRFGERRRERLVEEVLGLRQRDRRHLQAAARRASSTVASRSSAGTTRFTRPMRSASAAVITSARNASSLALCTPISRGRSHEPP